jgi:hypothetical protein
VLEQINISEEGKEEHGILDRFAHHLGDHQDDQ